MEEKVKNNMESNILKLKKTSWLLLFFSLKYPFGNLKESVESQTE